MPGNGAELGLEWSLLIFGGSLIYPHRPPEVGGGSSMSEAWRRRTGMSWLWAQGSKRLARGGGEARMLRSPSLQRCSGSGNPRRLYHLFSAIGCALTQSRHQELRGKAPQGDSPYPLQGCLLPRLLEMLSPRQGQEVITDTLAPPARGPRGDRGPNPVRLALQLTLRPRCRREI